MDQKLARFIYELSLRIYIYQESLEICTENLSNREILLLELLKAKQKMSISEIAEICPSVSMSTISATISSLWKEKGLVSKTIDKENPRVTTVSLTEEGQETIDKIIEERTDTYQALIKALNLSNEERETVLKITERAVSYFDKISGPIKYKS